MASLRTIKRRLKSVKSISQITRAMKMVAAVRLKKAQDRVFAARPYAHKIIEVMQDISGRVDRNTHPLLRKSDTRNKICVIIVTADRGLCGSFNSNVIKRANHFLIENGQKELSLMLIGKKCADFYKRWKQVNFNIIGEFIGVFSKLCFECVSPISQKIVELYTKENFDEIIIIYNEFKSAISQKLTVKKLLPIENNPDEKENQNAGHGDYEYEPDQAEILNTLLPTYINTELYRILLESAAAEFGAKMTAMTSATDNAADMISNLTMTYNKIRQANITREISEIVGGANAIK